MFSIKMEALEIKVNKLQVDSKALINKNEGLKATLERLKKEKLDLDNDMVKIFSLAEKIERNTKTVKPNMDEFELNIWVGSLNRLSKKILEEKPNKGHGDGL